MEATFSIIEKSLNLSAQHPAAAKPQIQFTNWFSSLFRILRSSSSSGVGRRESLRMSLAPMMLRSIFRSSSVTWHRSIKLQTNCYAGQISIFILPGLAGQHGENTNKVLTWRKLIEYTCRLRKDFEVLDQMMRNRPGVAHHFLGLQTIHNSV